MMKKVLLLITAAMFICVTACSDSQKESADLLIINCNIAPLTDNTGAGNAIAVKGDTIYRIGMIEQLIKLKSDSTVVIDAKNNFVMPGFNDSHLHLESIGKAMEELNLSDVKNWDEVIMEVVDASRSIYPGSWIIGRGWHQDKWDSRPMDNVEGYPVHKDLSAAVAANPVMLQHASGHALFANAKAMELAGITDSTADPEGGRIVRDKRGHATGIFEENAMSLVENVYNDFLSSRSEKEILSEKKRIIKLALNKLASYGITSAGDAGVSFDDVKIYKSMAQNNELTTRLNVMLYAGNGELKKRIGEVKGEEFNNKYLRVRSVKKYIDGALGSRGAWLFESYADLPGYSGMNVIPESELTETAKICKEHGLQLCTHAIGTKGNSVVLDIYEKVLNGNDSLRWRIEHAQHVKPSDVKRFADSGVIAAMQGKHCTSDAPFVKARLGEERAEKTSYLWREMINAGVVVCNGTDAPVEPVNPFLTVYASVTRRSDNGNYFYPEQAMTRKEALLSYTLNGAYASFEEDIKGTIEQGKLADIIILDKDLLNIPEDEINNVNVLFTITGGKVVYESK